MACSLSSNSSESGGIAETRYRKRRDQRDRNERLETEVEADWD